MSVEKRKRGMSLFGRGSPPCRPAGGCFPQRASPQQQQNCQPAVVYRTSSSPGERDARQEKRKRAVTDLRRLMEGAVDFTANIGDGGSTEAEEDPKKNPRQDSNAGGLLLKESPIAVNSGEGGRHPPRQQSPNPSQSPLRVSQPVSPAEGEEANPEPKRAVKLFSCSPNSLRTKIDASVACQMRPQSIQGRVSFNNFEDAGAIGLQCGKCHKKFRRQFLPNRKHRACASCGAGFCFTCLPLPSAKCTSCQEEAVQESDDEKAEEAVSGNLDTQPTRVRPTRSLAGEAGKTENDAKLSIRDLTPYERDTKTGPWACRLPAPVSIFRCRDREIAANLSIGLGGDVVSYKSPLAPTISCSCQTDAGSSKFQSATFEDGSQASDWKIKLLMDFLAVGESYLFVILRGMGKVFYGMARVRVRKLRAKLWVVESLDVTCRTANWEEVRLRGSMCWKIYNEDFEGPICSGPLLWGESKKIVDSPTLSPTSEEKLPAKSGKRITLADLRKTYQTVLGASRMASTDLSESLSELDVAPSKSSDVHHPAALPSSPKPLAQPPVVQRRGSRPPRGNAVTLKTKSHLANRPQIQAARILLRITEEALIRPSRRVSPSAPNPRGSPIDDDYPRIWDPTAEIRLCCPFCEKPAACVLGDLDEL